MSESYADFITKTLGIELETWQHDLIAFYAQRYSHDDSIAMETPEFKAPDESWFAEHTPQGYKSSEVQTGNPEFSIVDALIEWERRWRDPTDEEKAEDERRVQAQMQYYDDILAGRKPPLYDVRMPSKPLWENSRAPLNRAERRAAARQNPKEV